MPGQVIVGDTLQVAQNWTFRGGERPLVVADKGEAVIYDTAVSSRGEDGVEHLFATVTVSRLSIDTVRDVILPLANKHRHTTLFLPLWTACAQELERLAYILSEQRIYPRRVVVTVPPHLDTIPCRWVFDTHMNCQVMMAHTDRIRPAELLRELLNPRARL